ncbi:MAG: hypothetical protein U1F58_06910 [Burkholderiales bacterium]
MQQVPSTREGARNTPDGRASAMNAQPSSRAIFSGADAPVEATRTNAMTLRDTELQSLPEPGEPRRLRDATPIVVVLYAMLVLAAPLIVRYWPDPDSLQVVAPAMANAAASAPCGSGQAPALECMARPAPDDID